jgi:hypothetical protein
LHDSNLLPLEKKSSNLFDFREEEFSAKKKVGGEKKFPFYPNWQI